MANRGFDDLDREGKTGAGLLAALLLGGIGAAAASSSNKKQKEEKNQKMAQLQSELNNVRYQLNQKKANIFRQAWYADEIEQLEARERELVCQINAL